MKSDNHESCDIMIPVVDNLNIITYFVVASVTPEKILN